MKLSCGNQFDIPIVIKLKVENDSLIPENTARFKAVYFDETAYKWILYENSQVNLTESKVVFETDHLTKLSWWNEENLLHSYTDKFVNDKVTVYYKPTNWIYMDEYAKKQSPQTWHLSPGDPEYGTPVMVQDMAKFCNEVMTKFKSLGLEVPESINIFTDLFDDDGNVGIMGMIRGYLNISVMVPDPEKLRSVIAHEYMHYTQDYYISAHEGNTFWMEANGHTADRVVWDSTKVQVSESEHYLLDSRGKNITLFNSLSNSWDYWDKSILTQKILGNIDYCYLAGCFIHYMRSYRPGTKLKPEILLKENTYTGSWKNYLNDYITNNLNSTIGNEFNDYVKFIFEGSEKNFTVLNIGDNAQNSPLKYINQTDENFSRKHLYRLPEDQLEIPVEYDNIERTIPYLAAKTEQFYNLSANRSLCVKYKRLHTDTVNIKVYICQYDATANKLKMENVSRLDSSYFFIGAATEQNMKDRTNQAYMLIINKNKDNAKTARYDLKILPVADFEYCFNLDFHDGYNSLLYIHNFSDGEDRRITMGLRDVVSLNSKTYTDSSFTSSYSGIYPGYSFTVNQEVYYNFLNGDMIITETFNDAWDPVFDDEGCVHRTQHYTMNIVLKDIFIEPMEKEYMLQGAGIYKYNTLTTANTKDKIVSISYDGTDTCTDGTGNVVTEDYSYTGTNWAYSENIDLVLQFK